MSTFSSGLIQNLFKYGSLAKNLALNSARNRLMNAVFTVVEESKKKKSLKTSKPQFAEKKKKVHSL